MPKVLYFKCYVNEMSKYYCYVKYFSWVLRLI